ncbi:hypothetical protein [Luteipulveratus halotolerans]|uniref:Uncharacterized protein n=1 Tax=Luteipulveratus halotolerans TaxID=1631356 RepID=A0A0L6CK04_9MICO|nr:hypothetical protein [Luteipulveratus halotolerans]KNX38059.1 hypothetical protein VV01_14375 [Luteipulveratus halotolerans]
MDMNQTDRERIAQRVKDQRTAKYGTKSGAYQAAGLNAATWDRIESGQSVREDRLVAALKTLWPDSGGNWRKVPGALSIGEGPVFSGQYSDPGYINNVENWVSELQDRIEALEAEVYGKAGSGRAEERLSDLRVAANEGGQTEQNRRARQAEADAAGEENQDPGDEM